MRPEESELDDEELENIAGRSSAGRARLRKDLEELRAGLAPIGADDARRFVDGSAAPLVTIRLLRNCIDLLRQRGGGQPIDDEELAYDLGYLYAEAMAAHLGWSLVFLKTDFMKNGEVAVVAPDRRYAAYPAMFIYRLLAQPERDNTLALSVNMLAESAFASAAAGSYQIVIG